MDKRLLSILVILIAIVPAIALCDDNSTGDIGAVPNQDLNTSVGGFTQNDIQQAINSASPGSIVQLKAGTYTIDSSLNLKSGVSLVGAGNSTIIKGDSNTGGSSGSTTSNGWINGNGVSNINIANLVFVSDASGISAGGHGETRNLIRLIGCSNVNIQNCVIKPFQYNDFVKSHNGKSIVVSGCSGQSGHDFVEFLGGSTSCRVTNCNIKISVNTGVRNDGTTNCRVDHNTVTGVSGTGWCMNEVENSVSGLEIDHNIFYDYHGSSGSAVVQPVHSSGDVHTHDNVMWNVGPISMGATMNNTINPDNHNIAYWISQGFGAGSAADMSVNYNDSGNNDSSNNDNDSNNGSVVSTDNNSVDDNSTHGSCSYRDSEGYELGDPNYIPDNTTVDMSSPVSRVFAQFGILGNAPVVESNSDMNLSAALLSSSLNDVTVIQTLNNGTPEQISYANQLLAESDYKEQVARDLFNMSIKNEEIAKGRA